MITSKCERLCLLESGLHPCRLNQRVNPCPLNRGPVHFPWIGAQSMLPELGHHPSPLHRGLMRAPWIGARFTHNRVTIDVTGPCRWRRVDYQSVSAQSLSLGNPARLLERGRLLAIIKLTPPSDRSHTTTNSRPTGTHCGSILYDWHSPIKQCEFFDRRLDLLTFYRFRSSEYACLSCSLSKSFFIEMDLSFLSRIKCSSLSTVFISYICLFSVFPFIHVQ